MWLKRIAFFCRLCMCVCVCMQRLVRLTQNHTIVTSKIYCLHVLHHIILLFSGFYDFHATSFWNLCVCIHFKSQKTTRNNTPEWIIITFLEKWWCEIVKHTFDQTNNQPANECVISLIGSIRIDILDGCQILKNWNIINHTRAANHLNKYFQKSCIVNHR